MPTKDDWFFFVSALCALAVFAGDIYFLPKIAIVIPYLLILMSSMLHRGNNTYVKFLTALCSSLILAGYLLHVLYSHNVLLELANRIGNITIILLTGLILYLQNETYNKLKSSELKFNTILELSKDSILTIDNEGKILVASYTVKTMLGWDSLELINQPFFTLFTAQSAITLKADVGGDLNENYDLLNKPTEIKVKPKDKAEFLCEMNIRKINSATIKNPLFIVVLHDIEERKKNEERLIWLATHDDLTGAYNKNYFSSQLEHVWLSLRRKELPVSLILLDIDFFKLYNEAHGYVQGDECLKLIAEQIKPNLKRNNDFVARYSGEEFAIVLPDTNREGAAHVAEAIKAAIAKLALAHNKSEINPYITVSMGIASLAPQRTTKTEDLIRQADYALYQAKSNGGNRFVVYQEAPAL